DWAQAAELAVRLLMPQVVIISLLKELDRWRDEAHLLGISIPASG
ncbi:MAG: IS701 family transposase, partial [Chroococcidiopsidaceae cyanobacterium CP_BM_ER_R8_30]|nr:IS701 family transposase [Chroococcidiopsidaceae cyanobacterium CP_BM_ER_R8_30]